MTPPAADDASSMQTHTPPPDAGAGVDASMMIPPAAGDASMPPGPSGDAGGVNWDGGAYPRGGSTRRAARSTCRTAALRRTPWMGRGVNVDDIFLCGNNNTLLMKSAEATLEKEISGLMSGWKPNFIRISLGMNSYTVASWLTNPAQYKTPMTNVINAIGAYPNVHVLVTLRSDKSMIGEVPAETPRRPGFPRTARPLPTRPRFPPGPTPRTSRSSTRSPMRAS